MSSIGIYQPFWLGLHQAAINSLLNKNNPYDAIMHLRNMMAFLPDKSRPTNETIILQCGDEPEMASDFSKDPDDTIYDVNVREYLKKYSFLIYDYIGKYIDNEMSSKKL